MTIHDRYFPHLDDAGVRTHLADRLGTDPEALSRTRPAVPGPGVFDFAEELPRIERESALDWRDSITSEMADEFGFPAPLNSDARKNRFDLVLGRRLANDVKGLVQEDHPEFWAWLAAVLMPHLVVYRHEWPNRGKHGEDPTSAKSWSRFNTSLRNGLRRAHYRVAVLGDDIAERCIEQEFQDVLERPAFGNDPRVAQLILRTLANAAEDPDSTGYGSSMGRTKHCAEFSKVLRVRNSMRPLCFLDGDDITAIVLEVIRETATAG